MKILITVITLTSFLISSAQSPSMNESMDLKNFSINVSVDSLKDLNATFTISDFKDILKEVSPNETIYFKLTCNNQSKDNSNNISYKITGNSNEPEVFLKRIQKVKVSAIKYYNNKV